MDTFEMSEIEYFYFISSNDSIVSAFCCVCLSFSVSVSLFCHFNASLVAFYYLIFYHSQYKLYDSYDRFGNLHLSFILSLTFVHFDKNNFIKWKKRKRIVEKNVFSSAPISRRLSPLIRNAYYFFTVEIYCDTSFSTAVMICMEIRARSDPRIVLIVIRVSPSMKYAYKYIINANIDIHIPYCVHPENHQLFLFTFYPIERKRPRGKWDEIQKKNGEFNASEIAA